MKPVVCVFLTLFGVMIGCLLVILSIYSILTNKIYSEDYTHYYAVVTDIYTSEPYTTTVTERYKSTNGKYKTRFKTVTNYKQDITISYNDTEYVFDDYVVNETSMYHVEDEISIYVSNTNPNDVIIHYEVPDTSFVNILFIKTLTYWLIFIIVLRKLWNRFRKSD